MIESRGGNIAPRQNCKLVPLSDPWNARCFTSSFLAGTENNEFSKSVIVNVVPEVLLICPGNNDIVNNDNNDKYNRGYYLIEPAGVSSYSRGPIRFLESPSW